MVIDIHVHPSEGDTATKCDEMVAIAQRAGIDHLVLLGVVGKHGHYPSPEQIRASNEVTLAWMRHNPEVCLGFCYLNPAHDPGFIREEVARCLDEGGMKGIKLWIAVKATDPRLDLIMDLAAEREAPVLHHSWYKTVQGYADESDPAEIADLGRRHPETTIIMAHLTGCGQRGVADIQDLPNIVVDTSGSQPVAGMVEYAVRELGDHRVLFGSDVYGRDFSVSVERVHGAKITPRQKRMVLGRNAARLLKMEYER